MEEWSEFFHSIPTTIDALSDNYSFALAYGRVGTQTMEKVSVSLSNAYYYGSQIKRDGIRHYSELKPLERKELPPIEDLNQYLPDCLKLIIKKRKLINRDRCDATAYLYDMKYDQEDIMEFYGETNDEREFKSNFISCGKQLLKGSNNNRRFMSMSCETMMNGNYLRTGAEELCCPHRKSTNDNNEARKACFSTLVKPPIYFYHPVDYVTLHFNKK
jgi:hypothetical protein